MKRLLTVAAFCLVLLLVEAAFLVNHSSAKSDVVGQLLQLPAPPPPNPLVVRTIYSDGETRAEPPGDDAPMADLWAFWSSVNIPERSLGYRPKMSDKTFQRIKARIEHDPTEINSVLGAFDDSERSYELIKKTFDKLSAAEQMEEGELNVVREWLVMHSPYFTNELLERAQTTKDTDTYVENQEELLQLTRFDFDKARPLIDEMYARDEDKATHVLARWALYRHAIESGSSMDADRYRDELKAIVENKELRAPLRDLAMDALVTEPEWPGREEWWISMFQDKTLQDLGGYTGLTTLVNVSSPGMYSSRMLELLNSGDPVVRSAAVKNLLIKIEFAKPEVLQALLPWLENPTWAEDPTGNARSSIIKALQKVKLADSVPALIRLLHEENPKAVVRKGSGSGSANVVTNRAAINASVANAAVANAIANAAASAANAAISAAESTEKYPYRDDAVEALGFQGQTQAGPPLRRLLASPTTSYDRIRIMKALILVKGFSIPEQVDALESSVRRDLAAGDANTITNEWSVDAKVATPAQIKASLAEQITTDPSLVTDDLAAAVVARIDVLEAREPLVAQQLRKIALEWVLPPIDVMSIRDVKRGVADQEEVLRVLARRKVLTEKNANDVFDLRSGPPLAVAVAACVLNDAGAYEAILNGQNAETKRAVLACGRLVRAKLPLAKAFEAARGADKLMASAAAAYLESEDSPESRQVVLSLHPNEAKILGSTTAFKTSENEPESSTWLSNLFTSADEGLQYYSWYVGGEDTLMSIEKRLQKEVKEDDSLVGIYGYDANYVRIYKDRVIYSWEEDDSRYKERPLEPGEFDYLKQYLAQNQVDTLPPFLECFGDYCEAKELVMLSRAGGRRIFMTGQPGEFFAGLDKFFAEVRKRPATVKYALSREVPGLDLMLADDNYTAYSVWKDGDDLRVVVSDNAERERVDKEVADVLEHPTGDGSKEPWQLSAEIAEKRKYDGYSWRKVVSGSVGSSVSQPAGVEYIVPHDGLAGDRVQQGWKARVGSTEYRGGDGLYKIVNGREEKVSAGVYETPLLTSDGKWVITYRGWDAASSQEMGIRRTNTLTKKEFTVKGLEDYMPYRAAAYLPNLRRVLLAITNEYDMEVQAESLMLLDPETGVAYPAVGEYRPLAQQTFRPLQRASVPGTFWAALPNSEQNSTEIGVYDARTFKFRAVRTIPKIIFDSMAMWVDEAAGSVYFVYKGQLLKLPLKPPEPAPK
ncbi:MAG TPA: HEAT repeat domain-containing protein [Pyrinomonadaceae bacterium]|mgnify:FL=1|nr:HEAT repeat domain-containing protein [Pyrinomonadaceae bacterium]